MEEKLRLEKMEPAARKQYNKHLKEIGLSRSAWETALYEGERKGLEKGRIKEKREIVLSSFKKGHSVELIAEIVGITIEDVDAIIKEG